MWLMSSDTRQAVAPGVRWIWVPERSMSGNASFAMAAGFVFLFFFGYFLSSGIYRAALAPAKETTAQIILGLSIGLVLGIGWMPLFLRLRAMHQVAPYRWRIDRLRWLLSNPAASERLPHRIVEHFLLGPGGTEHKLERILVGLPTGTVVAINASQALRFHLPANDTFFEPIAVDELHDEGFESEWPDIRLDSQRNLLKPEGKWPALSGEARKLNGMILWFNIFLIVVLLIAYLGGWGGSGHWKPISILVAVLTLNFVSKDVAGRRWWLVPGGMVFRDHRSWRSTTRVGMVTAERSPLIVHLGADFGVVRHQGRAVRFDVPDSAGWCVLAAWMSTATRPTKEEILAFFGPDAEWEG